MSPSSERTSTSKWNLSAASLAAVGSSTSFTLAMTPSSRRALITSPDFRRMAAASSPTVTDSGTVMSSRLIPTGGSGGSGLGGAGGTSTFGGGVTAAAGLTGAAGTTGLAGDTGGTGRDGTTGVTRRGGGGAMPAGDAAGTMGRGATGGGTAGRSGVGAGGSFLTIDGPAGVATAGAGPTGGAGTGAGAAGVTTGVAAGAPSINPAAAAWRNRVAAGLNSSAGDGAKGSSDSMVAVLFFTGFVAGSTPSLFFLAAAGFLGSAVAGLGLGTRVGLAF